MSQIVSIKSDVNVTKSSGIYILKRNCHIQFIQGIAAQQNLDSETFEKQNSSGLQVSYSENLVSLNQLSRIHN